jgi:malonyl-CoA/methylmalonyl-CoA synthetase
VTDNLYSLFQDRFLAASSKPSLIDADGHGPTYGQLDDLSARFASVLRSYGVEAGDRIVVQVDKSVGAMALYLGCLRIGAIFVPLNTAYTAAEVDYFLGDSEPRLFVTRSFRDAAADHVVVLGTTPDSPLWAEALAAEPDPAIAPRTASDIAAILYTSGTTGRSKGAMLSHGNLTSNAQELNRLWGFTPDDVLLHALPVFHVHGLFIALHTAFLSAATTIFVPSFDAAQIKALLPKATVLMGVPTFYTRLLALQEFGAADCQSVRLFISGSAPMLAETHRQFEARTGQIVLERYGMTEAGIITSNPLDGERVAGTVGYPLPGVELRIADEQGTPLAHDTPGVIEIKGPNVFGGYWRMPEKTAQEFRDGGWFITGDVAVQSPDGRVTIVGRAKDLIISGGYNIYPKEIESVLDAVAGVAETAVIGVPDPDFGESVVALVVAEKTLTPSMADLEACVREQLARFKHPRKIILVEDLPRNAMGKVQKNVLRDLYRDCLKG